MRKSIATVSLSGDLTHKLSAAAAARFDGIELFDADLIASDLSAVAVGQRCADLGLSIDLFQPIRDVEGCPPHEFPKVIRRIRRKFAVMQELGTTMCLMCSNALPTAINDPDLSAEQLHALGEVAAEYGCHIAFEALAWGRHINRVQQAWDVVQRADQPQLGLAVDTFHLGARGDTPAALAGIPGQRISYVQIADAPRLDMNVLSWSRHYRCFPGQGDLDITAIVAHTIAAGYRGPLSLEVFSDVVRTADPRATALDAMRSLLFLEEHVRHVWAGVPEADRPRVDLFDPPPVPQQVDFAFVEFAVAPGTDSLHNVLTGLGFAHVGNHQTRPVQWWRNGEASLCLTTLPVPALAGAQAQRPFVSALGLLTQDVRDVATRATALLWPKVRHLRGPYESALPGIDTPSGMHVFLSSPAGCPDDWRAGYLPVPGGPPESAPGDWLGIDHCGVMVPAEVAPAEQSFYRAMFDVTAGDISEFHHPHGRMVSRPLHSPCGDVRIGLAVSHDNENHPAHGITHIAFGCPDIVAAVTRARSNGVEFLAVPDNYYRDLDARFTLAPGFLPMLQQHSLMYDETEAGSFLHAYTPLINNSFAFELVQRNGDYDGYGTPNTQVRLVAQAR